MQNYEFQLNYDEASYSVISYTGKDEQIVIPETFGGKPVTIVYDKVFAGHSEIRSVVFPETITDLGEFVFDGCMELRHLTLPSALTYLWGYTFVRCGIEEIVLPDGVRAIPPYAFKDCKNLRKVVCGSGMRKIGAWAFGGCDRLTEVVHEPDVEVSPDAFRSNEKIMEIEY